MIKENFGKSLHTKLVMSQLFKIGYDSGGFFLLLVLIIHTVGSERPTFSFHIGGDLYLIELYNLESYPDF